MTEKLKYRTGTSLKCDSALVYRVEEEEDELLFLCATNYTAIKLSRSLNLDDAMCSGGGAGEGGLQWCGSCPKCLYAEYVMFGACKVPNPHILPPTDLPPEPGVVGTVIGVDPGEPGSDKTVIHTFEPPVLLNHDKTQTTGLSTMAEIIEEVMEEMTKLLLEKNKSYGNSVAEPVRIFSKVSNLDQINVRIDDKLSRLIKGEEFETEDTEMDLAGYFILKRCVEKYNGIKRGDKTIESA